MAILKANNSFLTANGQILSRNDYRVIYYSNFSQLDLSIGQDIPQVGDVVTNYPIDNKLIRKEIGGKIFLLNQGMAEPFLYGPNIDVSSYDFVKVEYTTYSYGTGGYFAHARGIDKYKALLHNDADNYGVAAPLPRIIYSGADCPSFPTEVLLPNQKSFQSGGIHTFTQEFDRKGGDYNAHIYLDGELICDYTCVPNHVIFSLTCGSRDKSIGITDCKVLVK